MGSKVVFILGWVETLAEAASPAKPLELFMWGGTRIIPAPWNMILQ
jgi:hypothetical protein